jgi:hypothetical protein
MTDVLLSGQIFGAYGLPVYSHPLHIDISLYAEIFSATLRMDRLVSGSTILNTSISESAVLNRIVSDRYDELEKL